MENKIEEILENFDFERVKRVMECIEWKWAFSKTESGVPSIYELIRKSQRLLKESYNDSANKKEDSGRATGGFKALSYYDEDSGEIDLELIFQVDSWDTFNS